VRPSITQEFEYGCGIACFAFVAKMSYLEAAQWLGKPQASSERFWCRDIVTALNRYGLNYRHVYLKRGRHITMKDETIVLLARSKTYPVGHYLVRHDDLWMDPWINLPKNKDISRAISGYRRSLPGRPIYANKPMG
jgi:hypothetical protein